MAKTRTGSAATKSRSRRPPTAAPAAKVNGRPLHLTPRRKTAFVWKAGRKEATYRGDSPNSCSNTERACFRRSPELYRAIYVDKTLAPERTVALEIGGGLHQRVLLPDNDAIAVIPPQLLTDDGTRNTRSKEWRAFAARNRGRYLLKRDECRLVDAMQEALFAHPAAAAFLEGSEYELPMKALDPCSGLWLRCRADFIKRTADGTLLLGDIKTYGGDVGDLKGLCGHILRYEYDRQLAMYRSIVGQVFRLAVSTVLIFIEKRPPHRVRLVELDEAWMERADAANAETFMAMAEARTIGLFSTPGINEVLTLSRPRWADYDDEYAVGRS